MKEEFQDFNTVLPTNFGNEIVCLKRKTHVVNFPKSKAFYKTHCSHHIYYFHTFKCSSYVYPYHNELLGEPIKTFPDPIPSNNSPGLDRYKKEKEAEEKFFPKKVNCH